MSDYDPNRLDPNRIDPNRPDPRDVPFDRSRQYGWNWILGGIAAVLLVLIAMGLMTSNDRSAQGVAPAETTGQAEPPPAAPGEKISPRPVTPDQ